MKNKNKNFRRIAAIFLFLIIAGYSIIFAASQESGDDKTIALINSYEEKNKELAEELSLTKSRLGPLMRENEQLKSEISGLKQALQERGTNLDILEETNTQLVQAKINLEKQIQDLNRRLSENTVDKDFQIKQYQDQIDQFKQSEQNVNKESGDLIKQNTWLKEQYVKDHKITDEFKQQMASLAKEKEALIFSLKQSEKTIADLKAENELLFKQNQNYSEDLKGYSGKLKDKEQLEKRNDAVRQAYLQLKENYQQLEKQYKQFQDTNKSSSGELNNLKTKNLGLDTAVLQLKEEKQQLEQKYRQLQEETYQQSGQQYTKLQEDYSKVQADYAKVFRENEALKAKAIKENVSSRLSQVMQRNDELVKENSLLHYNLGVCFTQSQAFDKAVLEFEKVLKLNPNDSETHYNLGVIYAEQLKNEAKAMEHFKKYLNLSPEDVDADRARRYIMTHETLEGKN